MKVGKYYSGNWLSHEDLDDEEVDVTIEACEEAELQDEKSDTPKVRIAVTFKEFDKPLVLNKTNAMQLVAHFGDETEEWIDHRVTLVVRDVEYSGKTVPAIRIKSRLPEAKKKPTKRTTKSRRAVEDDDE